jgi:hypothetical protein
MKLMDTDKTRGRVFIVQETLRRVFNGPEDRVGELQRVLDLTPAAIYGELTVIFDNGKAALTPEPSIRRLRQVLKSFGPDDYLLPVGSPTLIGWATAIAADSNRGQVKMLVWDRETREYVVSEARLWGRRKSVDLLMEAKP